jgi:signal transduction histidine kinase
MLFSVTTALSPRLRRERCASASGPHSRVEEGERKTRWSLADGRGSPCRIRFALPLQVGWQLFGRQRPQEFVGCRGDGAPHGPHLFQRRRAGRLPKTDLLVQIGNAPLLSRRTVGSSCRFQNPSLVGCEPILRGYVFLFGLRYNRGARLIKVQSLSAMVRQLDARYRTVTSIQGNDMFRFMSPVKAPFRQLSWKLTLSYMVVTVGVLLVVALVLAVYVYSTVLLPEVVLTSEFSETWVQAAKKDLAPLLRSFLVQSPPDTTGIAELLDVAEGSSTFNRVGILRLGDIQLFLDTNAQVEGFVFGADGTLLGRTGHLAFPSTGRPFDASTVPGLEAPLQAALAGERDPDRLVSMRESENDLVVTVSVFEFGITGGKVIGAAAFVIDSLPTRANTMSNIIKLVSKSLFIFVLGAGITGGIFGSFTAYGMTKRFRRLSGATDAWSHGDFTEFIHDPAGDEISQLAQRLNSMAEQLQALLKKRQEMAIAEERNRLARDLHDSAKQQAFAASAQLGAAIALFEQDPPAARPHLLEAEKLIDKVRKELTSLILELRPVDLEGGGLASALHKYAIDWAHHCDIEIDMQVQGERALPLDVEQTLFRIAQEALANTARHSQARCAEILLAYDGDSVTLTILDDGRGFDTGNPQSGMGLRSMRERAELIDGNLTIKSALGEGTLVSVKVQAEPPPTLGMEL